MKIKILYDKYNTDIEKATLLFGETDEENKIVIEIDKDEIDEGEEIEIINNIKITTVDDTGNEIENELTKENLTTLLYLIRNILKQL